MQRFRDGKLRGFVATDVASRGIDVDDVDAGFNYEVPEENEYYVHRLAGRAAPKSTAWRTRCSATSPAVCGWTTSPATPAARSRLPQWMKTAM